MQLIDRYILKLFLLYLGAGILVFVTLFLTVDVMSFAVRYTEAGTAALLKYYAYHTPWVIYQLVPVACLMATLFTLSTLNRTNELTALFSMGMSLRRVAMPILISVAIVSVISFGVGDQLLPRFIQKRNYVEYVDIKKRPGLYSTVKTNKIWFRTENILFNIKTLNPETASAQGITLYYFDPNWDLTQLIAANRVVMKDNLWQLQDGLVTLFAAESSFPLTKSFAEKTITMNEDLKDIQSSSNSSEIMSVRELSRFIDRNKEAGLDTLRYEVDYHAKFGFAFAAFVMSLVGVPFSVSKTRGGGAFKNVGICLGLAFLYWVAYSSGLTLGEHGALPPIIAAWGPNLMTLGFAVFLMRRLKR
ncbi:MAG TPA: LPS export ABC transporter permease LptG [Bdellovibrionales bacterium]|nr:LPS export ABC transporter permease LptG [Bdellovibrionales bacterium]